MSDISNSAEHFPQPIILQSPAGDLAIVSPYGAHVLSWKPATGQEKLFLSPKAEFRVGAAIRGGVPIIFPQFSGLGNLPRHGFARTTLWETTRVTGESAFFKLSETPQTTRIWPYRFLVEYGLRIFKNSLAMSLSVTNMDVKPFSFTAALHGYFWVQDVQKAAVVGLQDVAYRGSSSTELAALDELPQVIFSGEVDRIYLNAPKQLQIVEAGRVLELRASGFPDAVIWNPGKELCAGMADMEPQGYRQFVCVEAAAAASPVQLAPGENWIGSQTLLA